MAPIAEQARTLESDRSRQERMQHAATLLSTLTFDDQQRAHEMAGRLKHVDDVNKVTEAVGKGAPASVGEGVGGWRDPFVVTLDNLEAAMRYQSWHPGQAEQGERVREVLTSAARVFLRELPDNPLRRRLLEETLQLRMLANMAISFPYGFGR